MNAWSAALSFSLLSWPPKWRLIQSFAPVCYAGGLVSVSFVLAEALAILVNFGQMSGGWLVVLA